MLRITVHNEKTKAILELEGRLAGAWVEELQRAWEDARAGNSSVLVNLAAVSYVDADGKRLLGESRGKTGPSRTNADCGEMG